MSDDDEMTPEEKLNELLHEHEDAILMRYAPVGVRRVAAARGAIRQHVVERETAAARVALARVSGALVDAGTVAVPEDPMKYDEAVRALIAERDEARADLAESDRLNNECVAAINKSLEAVEERAVAAETRASAMEQALLHAKRCGFSSDLIDAALSAPASPAPAKKGDKFPAFIDTMRHKDGSHCADRSQCRRAHLYLPALRNARLTPTQEANATRDVAFEDAAEHEGAAGVVELSNDEARAALALIDVKPTGLTAEAFEALRAKLGATSPKEPRNE